MKKTESCRDNLCNEIQLKGPQRHKHTQEQKKKEWASSVGLYLGHKPLHPHQVKVSPRGPEWGICEVCGVGMTRAFLS